MLLLPSILVCYWALIPWLFELLLLIMKLTHGPVPHWICLIDRSGFSFLVFSLFLFQYIYIYKQCLSCYSLSASLVPHMYVHLRYLFQERTREEKRMENDFFLGLGDSNIQSFPFSIYYILKISSGFLLLMKAHLCKCVKAFVVQSWTVFNFVPI